MPISFIHLDVRWVLAWQDDLKELWEITRHSGVDLGVIYHADPRAASSEAVALDLVQHENDLESALAIRPDQVIFQSWLNYPDHVLPETDPTSMTGIVLNYLRSHGG